jgi:hypothetical protein
MKFCILPFLMAFLCLPTFASAFNANCRIKNSGENAHLLRSDVLLAHFTEARIYLTAANSQDSVIGLLDHRARSGECVYESTNFRNTYAETTRGMISVSSSLAEGKDGELTLMVRQLANPVGPWWRFDTYECEVK